MKKYHTGFWIDMFKLGLNKFNPEKIHLKTKNLNWYIPFVRPMGLFILSLVCFKMVYAE